uniref:Putative GT4 n=1 Tax=Magnetococcus massalia (strain MO-1) TaxID=451514 RepID=A0A1S7LC90_MAGMO|nr:putative GT4 [Candidatus Magnetococcus massalia]
MAERPMHIMQLYHARYPQVLGGIDTMISRLIAGLKERDRISLFIPSGWQEDSWRQSSHDGVLLIHQRLPMPVLGQPLLRQLRAWLGWGLHFPRTLWRLRRHCREQQVDLIHLHTLQVYGFYLYLLNKLGGPDYLITLHGTDLEVFNRHQGVSRWFLAKTLAGAQSVVTVSPAMLEPAKAALGAELPLTAIFNGYQLPALDQRVEAPPLPKRFALMVGWVYFTKGTDLAVESWPEILEQHPDLHLVHVGSGHKTAAFTEALMQRARALAPERIHFLGRVPNDQLMAIYPQAEMFLMPSQSEGLPYALLEAGLLGLPALLTRIPAFEVLVGEGAAYYCEVDDRADFTRRVIQMADHPQQAQQRGQRLQQLLQQRCSLEQMCGQYRQLYSMLNQSR